MTMTLSILLILVLSPMAITQSQLTQLESYVSVHRQINEIDKELIGFEEIRNNIYRNRGHVANRDIKEYLDIKYASEIKQLAKLDINLQYFNMLYPEIGGLSIGDMAKIANFSEESIHLCKKYACYDVGHKSTWFNNFLRDLKLLKEQQYNFKYLKVINDRINTLLAKQIDIYEKNMLIQ